MGPEGAFNNHQNDSAGSDPGGAGLITTEAPRHGNISRTSLCRLFLSAWTRQRRSPCHRCSTAAAGAVLWGDALLMKRFLSQCRRSGSAETVRGYRRSREFALAGRNHPHLHHARSMRRSADWVSQLREQVERDNEASNLQQAHRAISSLYRWASNQAVVRSLVCRAIRCHRVRCCKHQDHKGSQKRLSRRCWP